MPDSPESNNKESSTFDPSIQTENLAYSPDKLLACDSCTRHNPPNRTNCLYCGRKLAIKAVDLENTKLITRSLEAWESGFNIILRSAIGNALDHTTSITPDSSIDLGSIIESQIPLPIARVESLKLAEILAEKYHGLGLRCTIISDADLAAERPPVRLSSIRITERNFEFIDFNARSVTEIPFAELALVVTGRLSQTRTEMLESVAERPRQRSLMRRRRPRMSQFSTFTLDRTESAIVCTSPASIFLALATAKVCLPAKT